jgi:hypothetical protein
MGTFQGVGRGIPSLGRRLRLFTQYARKLEAMVLLSNQHGGDRLVKAIQELIYAYDNFASNEQKAVIFEDDGIEHKGGNNGGSRT